MPGQRRMRASLENMTSSSRSRNRLASRMKVWSPVPVL